MWLHLETGSLNRWLIEMKSLEWVLIQHDWCPCKRKFGHRSVQRKDQVKTQSKDDHLQTKGMGLRRNPPGWHLDLGFSTSEPWENKSLHISHYSTIVCGTWYGGPRKLKHSLTTVLPHMSKSTIRDLGDKFRSCLGPSVTLRSGEWLRFSMQNRHHTPHSAWLFCKLNATRF